MSPTAERFCHAPHQTALAAARATLDKIAPQKTRGRKYLSVKAFESLSAVSRRKKRILPRLCYLFGLFSFTHTLSSYRKAVSAPLQ
jgi:hypothetical protein